MNFRFIDDIFLRGGVLELQIELRNRATQNDVTLRVTDSQVSTEIFLSSYLLDFVKH